MRFLSASEYNQLIYLVAKVAKQSVHEHEHYGDDLEIPLRQFFKDVGDYMDTLSNCGGKLDGN
jgi:hypothetical protein